MYVPINQRVHAEACQQDDGEGREDDVDERDGQAVAQRHFGFDRLVSGGLFCSSLSFFAVVLFDLWD